MTLFWGTYLTRLTVERDQKGAANPARLEEFARDLEWLKHSADTQGISHDNARGAYNAIASLQDYFSRRAVPPKWIRRDGRSHRQGYNNPFVQTNWPVGIPVKKRLAITHKLADEAEYFIEKLPPAEQCELYLQQGEIAPYSRKGYFLTKALDTLSDLPAGRQVEVALKIAEAGVNVVAWGRKNKRNRIENEARDVQARAIEEAVDRVNSLPRTVVTSDNLGHVPWWSGDISRKRQITTPNPEFRKGRKAIAKFNAEHVQELIESPTTAQSLDKGSILWVTSEVKDYWEPIVHGLFKEVIQTDTITKGDKEVTVGRKVSARGLEKVRRTDWPHFVSVVPPDVVIQAQAELDALLDGAKLVA